MSLASVAVLLQTALSLLVLVNSNPSLPQSMRDNAQKLAQQAIAQATAAIPSLQATTTTLPTINPNANLQQINGGPAGVALVIAVSNISTTPSTAHIEWSTSLPTDSKIFYQTGAGPSQVVLSQSGRSTSHIADLSKLNAATRYSYTIEAISGQEGMKIIDGRRRHRGQNSHCATKSKLERDTAKPNAGCTPLHTNHEDRCSPPLRIKMGIAGV